MWKTDRRIPIVRRALGRAGSRVAALLLLLSLATTVRAQELVCTDCHNSDGIPPPHSITCDDTGCSATCHESIDLSRLAHLSGAGTPVTGERASTCNACHNRPFEGVYHPYTINVNAGSLTPPGVVDLDQACGQCHGGGTAQASSTGDIQAGTRLLTVVSATGFLEGARVVVAGAGAGGDFESSIASITGTQLTLTTDALTTVTGAAVAQNPTKNGALYRTKARLANVAQVMHELAPVSYPVTFSTSAAGLTVNVLATVDCGAGVTCPEFTYDWNWGDSTAQGTVNPDGHAYAAYGSKTITLTVRQSGLLVGSATRSVTLAPPVVTFSVVATGLTVNVSATLDCGSGVTCPVFTYDWDWGDGTLPHGTVNPDTHAYATAGTKTISLTLSLAGTPIGSSTRSITLVAPDLPPAASGTCTWNADTWTATVVDTSTDTDVTPVQTVTVDWGDKTAKSVGGPGATLVHKYSTVPTAPATSYQLMLTAIDTALKASAPVTLTCSPGPVAPAYFSIGGKVVAKNGTTALATAVVAVKRGTATIKTVYTATNGTFTVGSLKPDTYTLTVTKSGYTFAVPAATITVGPSSTDVLIKATGP